MNSVNCTTIRAGKMNVSQSLPMATYTLSALNCNLNLTRNKLTHHHPSLSCHAERLAQWNVGSVEAFYLHFKPDCCRVSLVCNSVIHSFTFSSCGPFISSYSLTWLKISSSHHPFTACYDKYWWVSHWPLDHFIRPSMSS